jgi:hypothetical protein
VVNVLMPFIPDPGDVTLPAEVQGPVNEMAGLLVAGGIVVAFFALAAIGIAITAGTLMQNQWARGHAVGIGAVFGGLLVTGFASTLVGMMIGS